MVLAAPEDPDRLPATICGCVSKNKDALQPENPNSALLRSALSVTNGRESIASFEMFVNAEEHSNVSLRGGESDSPHPERIADSGLPASRCPRERQEERNAMRPTTIGRALCAALLAVALAPAETLYEQDGVSLEGSVRMAARAAATCVAAENADEATQANAGQPLHVWRLDYGVYNGSGRSLSQVTAHLRIESEWPPCSSWDGPESSFGGPLEWAGSYKALQRTGGLAAAGEARETVYVLAFHDRQPRFANWRLDFAFGEATAEPEVAPAAAELKSAAPEPSAGGGAIQPPPESDPCDGTGRGCFVRPASDPNCGFWYGSLRIWSAEHVAWLGECSEGFADGRGTIQWLSGLDNDVHFEASGLIREGRLEGAWTERASLGSIREFTYVDGRAHGPATEIIFGDDIGKGRYLNGKKQGLWTITFRNDDGTVRATRTELYANGSQHGRAISRDADGNIRRIEVYEEGELVERTEP